MLRAVLKSSCWRGEIDLRVGEGSVLADVRATMISGSEGVPGAILVSVADVTPSVTANPDQWHTIVDSLASRVALLDETGSIVAVNETWRRSAGDAGANSDDVGSNYVDVCNATGESAVAVIAGLKQVASGESEVFELVYPCDGPEGRTWFLMRAVPYSDGGSGWAVVTHQDVTTARLDHEQMLLQGAILDQIGAAVHTTDVERTVLTWNAAAERLYGWTAEEAIGWRTDDLMLGPVEVDPEIRTAISNGYWEGELLLGRRDGSTFPALVRTSIARDADDGRGRITCVVIDISERVRSQRELQAARDHLRAVTDSVGEAMFTLDLDGRVTYMNPAAERTLGWPSEFLQGQPLQDFVQSSNTGWSGAAAVDGETAGSWADGEVIRVDDDTFARADGTTMPVEYTAAPFATDHGIGGLVVVFRDISERKAQSQRLQREIANLKSVRRIQEALAHDGFVLHAQPIVDLGSGEVVQRELLIRMSDPDDPAALITPGDFLPVAEEHGLIGEIDRWVIDRSADIAATGLAVELNISASSIGDPQLLAYIESAIRRSGADPQNMVFEITETTLVSNEEAGRKFVERLHEIGSKVALDDFGTGYGGFTYLKQLPVDYLKIDIEFVRDLATNDKSRNVVEAIITLADRFNLKTVAEGVEDELTLLLLRDLGVDYAQGYQVGRPAPMPDRITADQWDVL
jgi:PAS domain S-box-containing protein